MALHQLSPSEYRPSAYALLLALLCLLPTLAFPVSPDHAIFFFGGKTLLDGGMLYRDFVDIKPPLIYELFAFIQFVFGSSEVSLRLFDVVWQGFTLVSLLLLLRRCSVSGAALQLTPVVYALGYTASNFTSTLQCETLAALPLVWMLYLYIHRSDRAWAWVITGVLYGFILHLKYTLGIIVLPFLLVDIFVRRPALIRTAAHYALFIAGFLACTAAVYAPLLVSGAWQDYMVVIDFVRTYAALQSPDGNWPGFVAQSVLLYFADKFSLVYTAAGAMGITIFLRRKNELPHNTRLLFLLLLWETVFLLVSIIVERKFLPYHFSRMHIALAPVIAIGLAEIWKTLATMWSSGTAGRRVAVILLCCIALVLSPFPRFARVLYGTLQTLSGSTNSQYTKSDPGESILIRKDQQDVAAYVRMHSTPGESVVVVSVHAAPVYFFLQPAQAPMLPSSQFYIADWCAPHWKHVFARELATANWLIVQTNDRHPDITGVNATGIEFMRAQHSDILDHRYRTDTTFGKFVVYRAVTP